jgi:hypothetical protein
MQKLWSDLSVAQWEYKNATTEEGQTYIMENFLEPAQKNIEAVTEAIAQYDETKELLEDINAEAREVLNQ